MINIEEHRKLAEGIKYALTPEDMEQLEDIAYMDNLQNALTAAFNAGVVYGIRSFRIDKSFHRKIVWDDSHGYTEMEQKIAANIRKELREMQMNAQK